MPNSHSLDLKKVAYPLIVSQLSQGSWFQVVLDKKCPGLPDMASDLSSHNPRV